MPLPKAENRTFEGCIHMQMLFGHSGLAMLTPFGPAPVAEPAAWGCGASAVGAEKGGVLCNRGFHSERRDAGGPRFIRYARSARLQPIAMANVENTIVRSGPKSWRVRRRYGLILVAPLAEPRHRSRIQRFRAVCLTAGRTALQRMPPFGPAGKCSQLSIDV